LQSLKFYYQFQSKIILSLLIILFSYPVYSAGSDSSSSSENISKSSYYYDALKLIKKQSFKTAIENLNKAEANQKKDADIYNYLGFSYRKMGNMKLAALNYKKALDIDPKHKGALEYQGEMFITLGQLDKARVNLKKLEKICFLRCEEEKTLKQSIINSQNGKKNEY
jgi:tetratricopeptide (TPR) repeat protein|tara:strand:+ start:8138 stop:8638 length:501 start_codon:yes stop_codon:yes gene_type:complete